MRHPNPDTRYTQSAMPPRIKKPKSVDVSHMHRYMDPETGIGTLAATRRELIEKMIEIETAQVKPLGSEFNKTALPGSPNVIKNESEKVA